MSEEEQIVTAEEGVVEEVVSEAGTAPEVEAAPADADTAPAASAEPDVAPVDSSPSTDSGEGVPASIATADEFGWEDWDGKHESLPEEMRSWGEKFNSYYATKEEQALGKLRTELEDVQKIYDALLGGNEDPRIAEYQQKMTDWEQKHNTQLESFTQLKEEYAKYQTAIQEAIDKEAEEYASWFKSENKDLFEDKKLETTFYKLVEEGWDLETAAKATRLSPQSLVRARKAKADGVPDSYALRLAGGTGQRATAPRPGARITAGATTPSRAPEQTSIVERNALSMKDLRGHVARNALKKHRS